MRPVTFHTTDVLSHFIYSFDNLHSQDTMGFLTTVGLMCWSIYFGHMLVCWTIRKLFDPQFGLSDSADENASEHGRDDHGFDRTGA